MTVKGRPVAASIGAGSTRRSVVISWRRLVGFVLVGAVVFGLVGWALAVVLRPPAGPPAAISSTTVSAETGVVERSLTATSSATWSNATSYPRQLEGVVTKVYLGSVSTIRPGDRLYDVDLLPVVAAQGSTPSFRSLQAGLKGPDVRQLQEMLRVLKFRTAPADGVFGVGTTGQVRDWQRATDQPVTGVVALGQVVFIPSLPVRAFLGSDIRVGAAAINDAGGSSDAPKGLVVLAGGVAFQTVVNDAQALAIEDGALVEVQHGNVTWTAKVSGRRGTDDGGAILDLAPTGTAPICGDACNDIPATGLTSLMTKVVIVPRTEGVRIPTSALTLDVDGSQSVTTPDGATHPVSVKAVADGYAIIDGIEAGSQLVISRET